MCGQSAGLLLLSSKVNALTTDLEMFSSSMLLKARRCYTCTDRCKFSVRHSCLTECIKVRGGKGAVLYKEIKERVPRMEKNHVKVKHTSMTQSLLR